MASPPDPSRHDSIRELRQAATGTYDKPRQRAMTSYARKAKRSKNVNIQVQGTKRTIGLLACMALSVVPHSVGSKARAAGSCESKTKLHFAARTANAFFVPKSEIEKNALDLSSKRYMEFVHDDEQYGSPKV